MRTQRRIVSRRRPRPTLRAVLAGLLRSQSRRLPRVYRRRYSRRR